MVRKKFTLKRVNLKSINKNARQKRISKNCFLNTTIQDYLNMLSLNNLFIYKILKG